MSSTADQQQVKHAIEDIDSWQNHVARREAGPPANRRRLHHHHHDNSIGFGADDYYYEQLEAEKEAAFSKDAKEKQSNWKPNLRQEDMEKRQELLTELWRNPGILQESVHGMMIDAGSTGSRLHVFEWQPRVLETAADITAAVAGEKLTFPGTESRWTDRLRPGLASFAAIEDDAEMKASIGEYLQPLMDFALTVLHSKSASFSTFPIYLRATAGMRTLTPTNRSRVMNAVRELFSNKTYCPFQFAPEQARVLAGEEEAIFDWAGVNFLLGNLLEQSEGAGTVINPGLTHGALDMGGASMQIGFYQPAEDIMSNLFKLQIGQAKHWNVYAHSFLMYGINEAMNRFYAGLAAGKSPKERLSQGIINPCMQGTSNSSTVDFRTNIHVTASGVETWSYNESVTSNNGYYEAVFRNPEDSNVTGCLELTKNLLHLDQNDWCNFAHEGDCSLAGIYQPKLPDNTVQFGEFLAFSNYYDVWQFLQLPERATIQQLYDGVVEKCSMTREELSNYNAITLSGRIEDDSLDTYCFRSAYVYNVLHNGFGFQLTDTIRAAKVIDGQKVGWALGAMLYEINTLPWHYQAQSSTLPQQHSDARTKAALEQEHLREAWNGIILALIGLATFACLMFMYVARVRRQAQWERQQAQYEPIKEVDL